MHRDRRTRPHRVADGSVEVGLDRDGGEIRCEALSRFEIRAVDVHLSGPDSVFLSELMQDSLGRIGNLGFGVADHAALVPLTRDDDGEGCRSHGLEMGGSARFRAATEGPIPMRPASARASDNHAIERDLHTACRTVRLMPLML